MHSLMNIWSNANDTGALCMAHGFLLCVIMCYFACCFFQEIVYRTVFCDNNKTPSHEKCVS